MIKAIIFDYGGVVTREGHITPLMSELFDMEESKISKIWKENSDDFVKGKESPYEFLERMKKATGNNEETDDLLKRWKKLYDEFNKNLDYEVLEFTKELKKKYKLYILTDTIIINKGIGEDGLVSRHFDRVFKSYEEGLKKPEPEAYLNVLEKTNLKPDEVIFIDDTKYIVEAAKKLGIKSIHYSGLNNLKNELKKLGVA